MLRCVDSIICQGNLFQWGCLGLCNAINLESWISSMNSLTFENFPILENKPTSNIHIQMTL